MNLMKNWKNRVVLSLLYISFLVLMAESFIVETNAEPGDKLRMGSVAIVWHYADKRGLL